MGDELRTIGSPAMLVDHRKRTNATLIRAKIADKLRRVAGHIARDNIKAGSPTAAFLVLVVPDAPPVVTWGGEVGWDDLQNASHALRDANMARYSAGRDGDERTIEDRVVEGWESRRRHEARLAQNRARLADEKPWMCEHCDLRYKTERGARQHERGCWKNPDAVQYREGTYLFHADADGRWKGYTLVTAPEPGDVPLPDDHDPR